MNNPEPKPKRHQEDFITKAIHAGQIPGYSVPPISQAVNAPHPEIGTAYISELAADGGPTVSAFEDVMKTLEGAAWSLAFPAGQSAIGQTLFGLLKSGDRVVAHRSIFNYATKLLREDLPQKWGIEVEWIDMRDLGALATALRKPTRLVYYEPIPNPAFHLLDSQSIIDISRRAGALTVLDNTLLTPYLYQPLAAGADVVLHSATKYLGGHGDALGGVVSGNDVALGQALHRFRALMGATMAPMNAFLLTRGIRTLALRVERHCRNSLALAHYLQTLEPVAEVRYPGLDDFETDPPVKAQYRGFGGILGVQLKAGFDNVATRYRVQMAHPWGSLGDIGTLVVAPGPDEVRDIPTSYLRIAVGLEGIEDIKADITQAIMTA